MEASLHQLLAHLQQPAVGRWTPSDFSLVPELTERDLSALLQAHPHLEDIWPLSPLQRGLYVHARRDRSAYVTQMRLDVEGADEAALEAGLSRLRQGMEQSVEAHSAVRVAMHTLRDGTAVQVVVPAPLPWVEEYASAEAEDEAWLTEIARAASCWRRRR